MKALVRALFVGGVCLMSEMGHAQAAPTGVATPPNAPVDMAKPIAAMEVKLADWPQLGRYRADNAALGPAGADGQRVVFYGDSITDGWGRRPDTGEFFPGKSYLILGISGQTSTQRVVGFREVVVYLPPAG